MQESLDPMDLLAGSVHLKLFVMLRRTEQPDLLRGALGDHLRWMIGQEKQGSIFMSGPVLPHEGGRALDGLTLIRADTLAAAKAIADQDPFIRSGIVSYEMREWSVKEGSFPLTITLSDSAVAIR